MIRKTIALILAATASVATAQAPDGTADTRYCMRVDPFTGSLIEPVKCWTRAQWLLQGVDVDQDWAANGVRTIA